MLSNIDLHSKSKKLHGGVISENKNKVNFTCSCDSQVNLVISDEFNRNKALEAIANISLPFLDFLKEMAGAGIVTYRVYIHEKKVIYIGIREEKLEEQIKV
ncbi:Phage envelope protein [Mycobacteroides abscessus subsp. abscessus]|nr:Phage envelope protein [Mycobacteroides abscessus subsp. abscessus]